MKRRNFIGSILLLITSCTATKNNTNNSRILNKPQKLRFAVTDVVDEEKLQRDRQPFRAALEEVLATKIEFFPVDSLTMAAAALQLSQVDLLSFPLWV
ncbi:MAG: hypothetical protein SWX82_17845 [Cyanobacteriota bacterium]|nr:hypothetical protein [Cyanobacteriota bacterium]